MSEEIALFQPDGTAFESRCRANGNTYWCARDFMIMLGYEAFASFEQAINKAIATCTTLGIPVMENFQQIETNGERDYKLSRFACYLVAMNGDVRKPAVALAQAYFAKLAEAAQQFAQNANDVERVQIRDEITDRERSLSSTAKQHGVDQYQFFQNEGYRGMYNMNLSALKARKGLADKSRSLLDFMDRRESAANLFRLTETEAKLKADNIQGQKPSERAAFEVGRKVRKMMVDTDGTVPESIPLTTDIKDVKKTLKQTAKDFTKLDKSAARKNFPSE